MPGILSAQKEPLTQLGSHPLAHRENDATRGQYRGAVSPVQAWQALQDHAEAILVDVRTRAEWAFVGNPDLSSLGKSVVQAEWVVFPSMERNPRFVKELQAQGVTPQQSVYLICRSGVRSRQAAELLAERGFTTYNVTDGFEGQIDGNGHRGVGGWRTEQLPWKQT